MKSVVIALLLVIAASNAKAQNVITVTDKEQILSRLILLKKAKCSTEPYSNDIYAHRENMEFLATAGMKVTKITVTNGGEGDNMGPDKKLGYRGSYVLEISDASTNAKVSEMDFGTCEVYFSCSGNHCVEFRYGLFDGMEK